MHLRCRKNQATLSSQEKSRFVSAVLAIKASGVYDNFVMDHMNSMPNAHRGPAFLPWHREFLNRYEQELRNIDSSVTLPYWDWTVDNSPSSSIWNNDFMGGNGRPSDGQVTSGAFAFATGNWTLTSDGPALRRRFGVSAPSLPSAADVAIAMSETVYDSAPWNTSSSGFRNRLEGWINGPQLHNLGHVWVGGSMLPASSPNDPVFFLHHCFVDKLWADWQRAHPGAGYLPVTGGSTGHNLNDPMSPFSTPGSPVTPANVLDHHTLGYAYDNEPDCRPKLKFADDPVGTLKFIDDPKLKFRDDPIGTLKFIDDPKLKFVDDPKLKFRDDPIGTLKFIDDPKLKFRDDPIGTSPTTDPIKNPISDRGNIDFRNNLVNPAENNPATRAAPFVLSTPHHSNAWAGSFPEAHQQEVQKIQEVMGQVESVLLEMEQANQQNQLTTEEKKRFQELQQEHQLLEQELQRLLGAK